MEINNSKIKSIIKYLGIALILLGAILFIFSFKDIFVTEVKFAVYDPIVTRKVKLGSEDENVKTESELILNKNFGIYIPRIGANAKVIPNVDPFNEKSYTEALYEGVAHSNTSSLPGQDGNVFLFAHSAVNFYESKKYNVYFYLLPKLKAEDKIYVSYKGKLFEYRVEEVKIVNKNEVRYLGKYKNYNTLTLMTCWPAGLDIKRVIVIAKEQ